MTNGEALSRGLARELHPRAEWGISSLSDNVGEWLSMGAEDYVSSNSFDLDHSGNGCGVLFVQYLHDELPNDWKRIVAAGGDTLAETYSKLTGNPADTAFSKFKEALQPFIDASNVNEGKLVLPEVGKSWKLQVQEMKKEKKKQQKERAKKIVDIVGGVSTSVSVAAILYAIWLYKRQQGAGTSSGGSQGIELPGSNV